MDAIGYLIDIVAYFIVAVGIAVAMISHVDQKVAIPGASPWRIRAPKLVAAAGPLLFISVFAVLFVGEDWLTMGVGIASLAAPWIAVVLIVTEWIRRRTEDRRIGIPRPNRPGYR
jgi:uncharacterized membrane protein YraQ (UPF0718 family)